MSGVARTCVAATVAFIAGAVMCGWLTPPAPRHEKSVRVGPHPKPGVVCRDAQTCSSRWKAPPEYYDLPWGKGRVRLPREFAGRGNVLAWAQRKMDSHALAHCQDPNWCLVLVYGGGSGFCWDDALFFERAPSRPIDPKPWKLRWISRHFTYVGPGDDAWIERDSRTLTVARREGRAISVSQLPRPVRHL